MTTSPPQSPALATLHRWKLSALAAAVALVVGLHTAEAQALALGQVSVQSALGEPLRAEIDLPQITPAEAESLRVATASAEVFRAQGMEYSSAAHGVKVQLYRRPDGSMALRLSSNRPINDPFMDLVIDANWSSGHIVRSYTMLFDPPSLRRPQATVTAAPQITAPRTAQAPAPAAAPRVAAPAPRALPQPAGQAPAAAVPGRVAVAGAAPGDDVTVRPGDTAGRIASANRPAGVSLDQMLVALMRANPDAFIQGNVNRLRAGAVLQLPSQAEAQATPAAEARRIVAAQSRDFNEFRRRLAGAAPTAQVAAAERSASGSVQTQVQDRKSAEPRPDKLTLSKGSVGAAQSDAQLAREKQTSQDAARMAELSRNIAELNRLSGAPAGAASPAPAGAPPSAGAPAAAPGIALPAPAGLATPAPSADSAAPAQPAAEPTGPQLAPPPAPTASAAQATPGPVVPGTAVPAASAPLAAQEAAPAPATSPAPAARPAAPAVPPEEPSFLASLMEDPLLPGVAAVLILALLGYGGWRTLQRRRNRDGVDSSFMESRLRPDSFFGASGGQRVDTASSELTTGASSSMAYSPSQLDAGDVDPVAEADVYLAYGRDLQAEEILKEAQRQHPERASIPAKLAEIYAKRQDRRALEVAAGNVLRLTNGQGPDWARVADLGRTLDPDNALYLPGARPDTTSTTAGVAVAGAFAAGAAASLAPAAAPLPDSVLPELDLDLDLDLHEAPPAPPPPSSFAAAATHAADAGHAAPPPPAAETGAASELPPMELDLGDLDLPGGQWDSPVAQMPPQELPDLTPPVTGPSPLDLDETGARPADSGHSPLDMPDIDLARGDSQAPLEATPAEDAPAELPFDDIDGSIDPLDLQAAGLSLADSASAPLDDAGMDAQAPESLESLEFDLGDLSLDLGAPSGAGTASWSSAAQMPAAAEMVPEDPLATKLALAEEFQAIGDSEGARALVEEVIAESTGDVKARAQRLLTDLS